MVVKLGSAVLTGERGLDRVNIHRISDQIADLREQGIVCLVVSSGAVAAGWKRLGRLQRPQTIPHKQATAAVGQSRLMRAWEEGMGKHDLNVAQVLLTAADLQDRRRYLNACHTLETLIEWGVVPIINENDTVATEEIKFGDNDQLASLLAGMIGADLTVLLTDTDGLYDSNPHTNPEAQRIPLVPSIDESLFAVVGESTSSVGTGGMKSKLMAAMRCNEAGIPLLIAPGKQKDILLRLQQGESWGSLFLPHKRPYPGKKLWLAHLSKPLGTLVVDAGAAQALRTRGSSLLPVGIEKVQGTFATGDAVRCVTLEGAEIGVGLTNYASSEIAVIQGHHSDQIRNLLGYEHSKEVIHRNHFVLNDRS